MDQNICLCKCFIEPFQAVEDLVMWSNQLRLYFSSIAYVLLQTLRRTALAGTELEKAQCGTIRLKLLKIGARIRVTVRKIWVSLSGTYPRAALFAQVLAALAPGC